MTLMSKTRRHAMKIVAATTALGALAAPATGFAGNWESWGYRTNSYETWALATQSPDFAKRTLPYFNVAAYVMATSWRWNAQGARAMGKCTGITWATAPVYVGCSTR